MTRCVRCGAEIEVVYFLALCDACCDERIAKYHPDGEAILADLKRVEGDSG